jgi:hypothetical protein
MSAMERDMAVTVKDNFTGFKQERSATLAVACFDYKAPILVHIAVDIALFL